MRDVDAGNSFDDVLETIAKISPHRHDRTLEEPWKQISVWRGGVTLWYKNPWYSLMVLVGLDEAGVGPAFGSVWAAAVHLPQPLEGLADSKKITEKRRDALRSRLDERETPHGLGEVTANEIDTLGLAEARRLVFERSLEDLCIKFPHIVPTELIVDGTIFRSWRDIPYQCIPKADDTVPCVSAASIYAKTTRDRQVEAWCDEDETLQSRYGIRCNKGYLSQEHISGIRTHGRTARHRHSYRIRSLENDDK